LWADAKVNAVEAQTGQFGGTQPSGDGHVEHRVVALPATVARSGAANSAVTSASVG